MKKQSLKNTGEEGKKNKILSILCRLKILKFLLNTAQEITSQMPGVNVKTKADRLNNEILS